MILFTIFFGIILFIAIACLVCIIPSCKIRETYLKLRAILANHRHKNHEHHEDCRCNCKTSHHHHHHHDIVITLASSPIPLPKLPFSPLTVYLEVMMTTGIVQRLYVNSKIPIPQPISVLCPDDIQTVSLVVESRVYDDDTDTLDDIIIDELEGLLLFQRVHTANVKSIGQLHGITATFSTIGDTIDVEFEDHIVLKPTHLPQDSLD